MICLAQQLALGEVNVITRLKHVQETLNMLTDSIARLEALAVSIETAVTIEAAQADAREKAKDKAIADLNAANVEQAKAIADLKAIIAANPTGNGEPTAAALARLDGAIAAVDKAASAITEIVVNTNTTPITDVVVGSVTADPAPTPPSVPPVPVFAGAPTAGGVPAAGAVSDAVKEVVDNAVA